MRRTNEWDFDRQRVENLVT